jgi:hypothetical protein
LGETNVVLRTSKFFDSVDQQFRINRHLAVGPNLPIEDLQFPHLNCAYTEELIERLKNIQSSKDTSAAPAHAKLRLSVAEILPAHAFPVGVT